MPPNIDAVFNIVPKKSLGWKGLLKGNLVQPLAMGMDTLNMFQMLPVDQSNPEGLM